MPTRSTPQDGALADARRLGLDLTQTDLQPHGGGVWAEHLAATQAFLSVATQWRYTGLTRGDTAILFATGLDYAAVETGLHRAGITLTAAEWSDLQQIEYGARKAMNEDVR